MEERTSRIGILSKLELLVQEQALFELKSSSWNSSLLLRSSNGNVPNLHGEHIQKSPVSE